MKPSDPRHPFAQVEALRSAPYDPGVTLCELPRGRDTRLRVARRTYEGRDFIALSVEQRTGAGWRTKSSATVRLHEIADVIAALESQRPADDEVAT